MIKPIFFIPRVVISIGVRVVLSMTCNTPNLLPLLRLCPVGAVITGVALGLHPLSAAAATKKSFAIAAGDAVTALRQFAAQSGRQIVYSGDAVEGVQTNEVKGALSAREALDRMLAGTALAVTEDKHNGALAVTRGSEPNTAKEAGPPAGRDERESLKKNKVQTPPTQEPMKRNKLLTKLAAMLALFVAPAAHAAEGAGSIEGRIQDVTTGDYLNNARVTIDGTNLTTLTNQFGEYRIADVPAGEVRVTAFYSGLPVQTATLTLNPDQRAVRDFELKSAASSMSSIIQLEAFTVKAEEMSDVAIAVNEQRFAPNIKTVLSADQFGDQSEGNVAEFLKFMPGIQISYIEQDARNVSVRGMPSHTTIVTANGNQIASAASTSASRVFEFEQLSINDIAQIEFNKTLVPDMPAEGIGGTINIVNKSAFQRSRPQFNYRTYLNFNTTRMELRQMPGPANRNEYLMRPGFDFTYIKPVNRNFGFTVSGAVSSKYNPQYLTSANWNRNATASVENPYLASANYQDSPKITNRLSGRVGMDWRFAPNDVLSLGFSQQYYDAYWHGRRWIPAVGTNPTTISPDFVQGRPGAGKVTFTGNAVNKFGTTWTPEFKYTHNGPVWNFEARGAYSHAGNHYRGIDKGHFQNVNITMGSLNDAGAIVAPTIRMDYTGNYVPDVSAFDQAGEPFNAKDVNNFFLNNARDLWRESTDVKKTAALFGQRVFHAGIPVKVKAGGDFRQAIRDMRQIVPVYTFVGADGKARTADDSAAGLGIVEERYSKVSPAYGIDKFMWPDLYKIWELTQAHPDWWTRNLANEHSSLVSKSIYVDERITSGFVRLDASMFQNRLGFVGGVRFQGYDVTAESGEVNNLGKYISDDDGNLIIDPATGLPVLGTGSTLEVRQNMNIERGIVTKGAVKGYYPSFNVAYRLRENLQFRFGYAHSVNYPNLNEVARSTTVSDFTASTRRVTSNSPLKPWFGKNYDFDIEYYTPNGGLIAVSFFRKEITDFIQQVRHFAGTPEAQAALTRYGYGQLAALNYEIVEKFNGGGAEFDGWDLDFRQNLDKYLPDWGRGLTVFFNTSYTAAPKGVSSNNISAHSQRLFNWGASYRRGKLAAQLKWNHVPEPKRTVPSIDHRASRTLLDVDLSYRIRPRITLFASAANVTSVATESYRYTENTPDYARRRAFNYFGVQCTVGIKGQF